MDNSSARERVRTKMSALKNLIHFPCAIGTVFLLDGNATSSCMEGNPDDGVEKTDEKEIDKEDFGNMGGEFIHLELSLGIRVIIFSAEAHRRYQAHQNRHRQRLRRYSRRPVVS